MKNRQGEDMESELLNIYDELFKYACSLTLDYDKAEDLVQDTAVKILDNQDKYVYDLNFKGWAYTIMRNSYLNNRLREHRICSLIDNNESYYLSCQMNRGLMLLIKTTPLKRLKRHLELSLKNITYL